MKIQHWYRLKVLFWTATITAVSQTSQLSSKNKKSKLFVFNWSFRFLTVSLSHFVMLKIKKHLVGYEKESLKWCVYLHSQKQWVGGVFNVLDALLYELMFMMCTWRNIREGSSQAPFWILQLWRFCWFLQLLIVNIVNQFPGFIVFYLDVQRCKKLCRRRLYNSGLYVAVN